MKNKFLVIALTSFLIAACSKDVDEDLNPDDMCDTEEMSYSEDIVPILRASCYGCHSTDAMQGGVILDNYEAVKSVIDKERLLGSIRRLDGFAPMPAMGPKLSDCNINKIAAWVDDGAQNN